ncbi:DUF4145 domain-containing protein [Candidatus Woesearchaeota archaeon]|nr:DUF4145 domain-containing protein [Candidatus Woesearchaeota archaeon]
MVSYEDVLHDLQHSIDTLGAVEVPSNNGIYNYKSQHLQMARRDLEKSVLAIEQSISEINRNNDELDEKTMQSLASLNGAIIQFKAGGDINTARMVLSAARSFQPPGSSYNISLPRLLKEEMEDDILEMSKCFKHECFKASIILAGKLLETALHKVYYDKTGTDLLQTAPGISIGNLIKKLSESGIVLDPSVANQAHLINQVRVQSVHARKIPFQPSREQTHATILFTIDTLRKLFENEK